MAIQVVDKYYIVELTINRQSCHTLESTVLEHVLFLSHIWMTHQCMGPA
jgi:hypothetical protein